MNGIAERDVNTHEVRLETPRLILREHRPEDLAPLHAMLSDPAVAWYLPGMSQPELSDTEAYLKSVMNDAGSDPRLRCNLIAEARETGEAVGCVGLHVIDAGPGGAHYGLGYFLRPDCWNRGFAAEAARGALDYIFSADAWRVSASCLAENLASRRVLEKCGMSQEGLLRAHTWHDGRWRDCAVYAVLKSEYRRFGLCFGK